MSRSTSRGRSEAGGVVEVVVEVEERGAAELEEVAVARGARGRIRSRAGTSSLAGRSRSSCRVFFLHCRVQGIAIHHLSCYQ